MVFQKAVRKLLCFVQNLNAREPILWSVCMLQLHNTVPKNAEEQQATLT